MSDDQPRAKRDLTSGSISGAIWTLAVPTMLATSAQTTISLVDTFWVGRLGPDAIAAVGMCGQVMFLLFTAFIGISAASSALVARAVGASDFDRADHVATQALMLTFAVSVVVGTLGYVLAPELMRLLGAEPEVARLGAGYLRITFTGAVFIFSMVVGGGILRGAGDAVTPLVITVLAAVVNLVLDPVLIFGLGGFPEMGVRGAALASVTAQAIAYSVGFGVLLVGRLRVRLRLKDFRVDLPAVWQIVRIGLPASVQMSLRAAMGIVLIRIVARFGTEVVAALTIGMRLQMVAFMPTFGIAEASGALVGQNLGAGKPDRAERSALVATSYTLLVMGGMALVYSSFGGSLVSLFTEDAAVIEAGGLMLRIVAPGLVFAAIGITLGRAIGGAGDTVPTAVFTFLALWGIQVPLAIWLSGYAAFGETGVWWASVVAGLVLCSMTATYFFSGRWKRKKV
ncbi:MAG: MATE family efflux transporter [Planctomycetota bacterium]|jgi:putative MATE family efflux protein